MVDDPWLIDLFSSDPELGTMPTTAVEEFRCSLHEWKVYVGFTNVFEYCEVCDEKRPTKL
jgi:hypothetical protein